MNKGLLSVDEALDKLLAGASPVRESETVPTLQASGRVLAQSQRSTMNVPPMDNSAMDGYAVRTADLPRPETRLRSRAENRRGLRRASRLPPERRRAFSPAHRFRPGQMPSRCRSTVFRKATRS